MARRGDGRSGLLIYPDRLNSNRTDLHVRLSPRYRFTATGTFDHLLTGATLVNDGVGGEPIPKLFCASIRVPLRPSKASKTI